MNSWIEQSIEYANSKAYLDDLFRVYPTIYNAQREISPHKWAKIEAAYTGRHNKELFQRLFDLEKFPFKDSYIGFLKLDLYVV